MFSTVQLYTVCFGIINDHCYKMQKIAIFITCIIILETLLVTQGRPYPDGDDSKKTEDPKDHISCQLQNENMDLPQSMEVADRDLKAKESLRTEAEQKFKQYYSKAEKKCEDGSPAYVFKSNDREVKQSACWHCCNCFLGSVRCCCWPIVFCAEAMPDDELTNWCSKNCL
ncbi:uncharacterized protein LOC126843038 isoform X1 [Adelges cooleyi]|uniref:uncharacterized protein LOC126843038 isoform X1 n=1 Tax=Adelges cooleyi TaxID=133065 RepID=UPI00217FA808|nr:uncharacterized protein LOC126843038 isoform X1 [Adelges cooleyi]